MKTIMIVLLLGGAGFLAYKFLYESDGQASSEAAAQFMASCRKASAKVEKVEAYCQCLAKSGVESMISVATRPASRAAVASCQRKVGHIAPPTGSGGDVPATSHGRAVEGMKNQLQKAYKRREPSPSP